MLLLRQKRPNADKAAERGAVVGEDPRDPHPGHANSHLREPWSSTPGPLHHPRPPCTTSTFLTQPSLALRWRSTSHKVHDRTLENTRAPAKPTPPHEEQEHEVEPEAEAGGMGGVAHANFAPPPSSSRHHLHLASEAGERLS
ncbi:apidaecins type 73-like [Drosophila subpulchrella]|uniref:apidaecins type 73-like n=1 Tax=Drosophila subpulchrella TaxID=1486046 RepID=UPI0018A16844|nr:apidaecins type 73-like [Drosophila subpulchrella]